MTIEQVNERTGLKRGMDFDVDAVDRVEPLNVRIFGKKKCLGALDVHLEIVDSRPVVELHDFRDGRRFDRCVALKIGIRPTGD